MNLNEVRRCHWIRRNEKTTTPSVVVSLHMQLRETPADDEGVHLEYTMESVHCVAVEYRKGIVRRVSEFDTSNAESFWTWLRQQARMRETVWVYAYGAGTAFILLGAPQQVRRRNATLEYCVFTDPPTIISMKVMGRNIMWADVRNYGNHSLSDLLTSSDDSPNRLGVNLMYDGITAESALQIARGIAVWVDSMLWWHRDHDCGRWSPTAAGNAWSLYRHRFMHNRILVHGHAPTLKLEMESYHGGRIDMWRVGRIPGPVYHLDVCSLYPFVMRVGLFPVRPIVHTCMISPDKLAKLMLGHACIARVTINSERHDYPVLLDGRIVYARGQFVTTLAGPELSRALLNREVMYVGEVAAYEKQMLFTKYVDYMYSLRQEYHVAGKTVQESYVKTLMNSLYGKFAQRAVRWEDEGNCVLPLDYGTYYHDVTPDKPLVEYRSFGGKAQRKVRHTLTDNTSPAVAAYVTSYARVQLDNIRLAAGYENVYHQYVDSILVNQYGYDALCKMGFIGPGVLGSLRLVATYDAVELRAPGDLVLDGRRKLCGVPPSAAETSPGCYTFRQCDRLSSSMARGDSGVIREHVVTKAFRRDLPGGRVDEYGRIHPLILPLERDSTAPDPLARTNGQGSLRSTE